MVSSINFFQPISFFTIIARLVLAQDDRAVDPLNHFEPPWTAVAKVKTNRAVWSQNSVYTLGSIITIKWTTNLVEEIGGIALLQDTTGKEWDLIAGTAMLGSQFTWTVSTPPPGSDIDKNNNNVFYFRASYYNTTAHDLSEFYSRYFNLTVDAKTSSSRSPDGSGSGQASGSGADAVTSTGTITAIRTMTTSGVQTVVQKPPPSSRSSTSLSLGGGAVNGESKVELPSSSSASDAAAAGQSFEPTSASFSASTALQPEQTSSSASISVSTKIFDPSIATSTPSSSTTKRNNMILYGGAIGGGFGCGVLILGVAYFVMRYRSEKRLEDEKTSPLARSTADEMRLGGKYKPSISGSYRMDSPTLPVTARPATSTSIETFGTFGTSILFPTFTDEGGERSISQGSD